MTSIMTANLQNLTHTTVTGALGVPGGGGRNRKNQPADQTRTNTATRPPSHWSNLRMTSSTSDVVDRRPVLTATEKRDRRV